MQTVMTLLVWKGRLWTAAVLDRRKDALIRNLTTGIVLAGLLYAAYLFFRDGVFAYVAGLEEIGYLLMDRLVSTGFMAFFILLVVSGFIAAIAVMFRSDETEYLFSTPVSALALFTSRFVDTTVYSSWAVLVMALPLLLAYARARGFGVPEYTLAGIFVLPPFVLTASALGTMLALAATVLSRRIGLRRLIPTGAAVFAGIVYAFAALSQPNDLQIPFTDDFRSLNLFVNNFHLNSHPLTPNYWLVQSLAALAAHETRTFVLYSAALISTALFACSLLSFFGARAFLSAWLASSESTAWNPSGGAPRRGWLTMPASGNQSRSLIVKDVLLFLRDPSQWTQLFLILLLLSVYFFNLRYVPTDIEIEHWRTIVALMNFGFAGFVLATLAVRFMYPSISLEGSSFWVIVSAPLAVSTLFREKFRYSFTLFLVVSEIMAVAAGLMLRLDGFYIVVTVAGILVMSVALSSLAIGLGAAFPSFAETDPSRIASGPGGILTILISLAYVAAMTALAAFPLFRYSAYLAGGGAYPAGSVIIGGGGALCLSAGITWFSLRFGAGALEKREY